VIEIKGRVALVTGAGSGIGRGLALALAAEGASVVVADIRADGARAVDEEIKAAGGKAVGVVCDVSDRASVRRMKAEAEASLGPVSLLFANAGATAFDRMIEMSEDDVDWILQVNLMGVSNCVMAFLPQMMAARDGHVVATASMAGVLPAWIPYHAPYSGAKLGVVGLMLNLRAEAAERGVGVTVLCPGGVTTSMRNSPSYRPARFGGPSDQKVRRPEGFFEAANLAFRPPEEAAQMVLRAVRDNRPMVVTDGSMRKIFMETYVNIVMEAFDEADAFDRQAATRRRD
jgi:NAD(P)-dependent dehydrogenase (short-subunit alcohol dehydrogenase family)